MNDNLKDMKLVDLEELIKALDEKGIEYDRNQIADAYFPLEDVEACLDSELSKKMYIYPNRIPCPLCGKPSEELKWIYFESPKWTWDSCMGTAGPLSICPDCHCLVEYIMWLIN